MAYDQNQALAEIAAAGQLYNEAKARGDMKTAESAHRQAQAIRQAAGIQGDGRTKTGLEGTSFDPMQEKIQSLAQQKMAQQPRYGEPVRKTDYFVEMQFDPRKYQMPEFKEPTPIVKNGIVTEATKQAALDNWLKQVGAMQDERAFDYGISSDSYNRREAERQYNNSMALGFSERYGVPIKPMGSLDNLFAQVKGLKPLDVMRDERNYERGVYESDRNYNRGLVESDRDYNRGVYESDRDFNYGVTQDALSKQDELLKVLEQQNEKMREETIGMITDLREGAMTPEQALNQIRQDQRAGFYTSEEAAQLEKVLQDYYYTTPPDQGGAYGPPNLSGFQNKQGGGDKISAIISANEGNYGSVNANDNGALSIGKFQWHAGRAQELLKTIKATDPKTYSTILGGTGLDKEISFGANWGKRVLSKQESALISKLLNTGVGQQVQNQIMARDLNGYMSVGRNLGISDDGALAYFADLYNQSPARAKGIAQRSNGTLASLHQQAMKDPVMGQYKTRRNKTYQSALS